MTNQPTSPSAELPPGTVIEITSLVGEGPRTYRYTLVARAGFGGTPGWHVDDHGDDDDTALVFDHQIDRGYTIVGTVEATVGLPPPSADLTPGTTIEIADGDGGRFLLRQRPHDFDGWEARDLTDGVITHLSDHTIDSLPYRIAEPVSFEADIVSGPAWNAAGQPRKVVRLISNQANYDGWRKILGLPDTMEATAPTLLVNEEGAYLHFGVFLEPQQLRDIVELAIPPEDRR